MKLEKLVALLIVNLAAVHPASAQELEKPEVYQSTIDPSPAEVALATECRNAFDRMQDVKSSMQSDRDALNELSARMTETGGQVDAAEKSFDEKKVKSSESQQAYDAAVEAKLKYQKAAEEHNRLVDKQIAVTARHNALADEFNDLNGKYFKSCSGRKFNATAIILTCKDERSAWCDLLR